MARWASHDRGSWSSLIIVPRPMQLGGPAEVVEAVQVVRGVLAGELDVVEVPGVARRPRRSSARWSGGASRPTDARRAAAAEAVGTHRQPRRGAGIRRSRRIAGGRALGRLQHGRGGGALATADPRVAALVRWPPIRSRSCVGIRLEPDLDRRRRAGRTAAARRSSASRPAGLASRTVPYESSSMTPSEPVMSSCIADPSAGRRQLVGQPDLDQHAVVERVGGHRALVLGRDVRCSSRTGRTRAWPPTPVSQRTMSQAWAPQSMYGDTCAALRVPVIGRDVPARIRTEDPDHPDRPDPPGVDRPPWRAIGAARKRCWETTARRTPAASAAATMASASARELVIGFSTRTCLPARAAASTCGRWVGDRRRDDHGVDVVAGEHGPRGRALDPLLARRARLHRARRRPPRGVASGTWLAITRPRSGP